MECLYIKTNNGPQENFLKKDKTMAIILELNKLFFSNKTQNLKAVQDA